MYLLLDISRFLLDRWYHQVLYLTYLDRYLGVRKAIDAVFHVLLHQQKLLVADGKQILLSVFGEVRCAHRHLLRGRKWLRIHDHLVHLKKRIAIMVLRLMRRLLSAACS